MSSPAKRDMAWAPKPLTTMLLTVFEIIAAMLLLPMLAEVIVLFIKKKL